MIRRRELLTLLGGVAAAATRPVGSHAQEPQKVKRVGVLIPYAESDTEAQTQVSEFREAFRRLGWTDGGNVRIDYRWASGEVGRIRTFAKELVDLQPDLIIARSTPVARALHDATSTIPIVFVVVSDPVGDHLVETMARPGGNVTGFTNVEASLGGKWLELLRDMVPRVARVAVLFNPKTSPGGGTYYLRLAEDAATSIGMNVVAAPVHDAPEIERAFEQLKDEPNGGLLVLPDVTTVAHRDQIIKLAAQHRLPAIYGFRHFVAEGGLASYGVDITDLYRRSAAYVDRILHGSKPQDLPVQAPTKFEMALNLKTAKALGLTIPPTLLARADEVIE